MKPLRLAVPCVFGCGGQLIAQLQTRKYDLYRCNKCRKYHYDYRDESDDQEVDLTFTAKNNEL